MKNQFEQPLNYQDWIDDQRLDEAWRKYDKQYHPVQEALSQVEGLPPVQPVRSDGSIQFVKDEATRLVTQAKGGA